ncbi:MAG TPA: type 1 glutamine amidotransferase domain-containing protein [Vicinamibacterales bacterium]|nr:type 1 glutamine amidotransferase domain-containing protein [Vicinamibacterales bacterium]
MAKRLLAILTNASHLTLTDGEEYPSGYWAEECAVPYELFKKAGYDVDFATLGGIAPTVDQSSLDPDFMKWVRPSFTQIDDAAAAATYRAAIEKAEGLRAPKDVGRLIKDDIAAYDGIYIVGGHGCMQDMPASPAMTRFLLAVLALDKPLASVCHGPTAFLSPRDMAGESPFAGYRVTCFSHVEEFHTRINGRLPYVLEIELKRLGVEYSKCPYPWGSHVVVDRNLVTGQNPFSSESMARQFLDLLAKV